MTVWQEGQGREAGVVAEHDVLGVGAAAALGQEEVGRLWMDKEEGEWVDDVRICEVDNQ